MMAEFAVKQLYMSPPESVTKGIILVTEDIDLINVMNDV
jgi:hypothetical protein